jgi:hypothetical protein
MERFSTVEITGMEGFLGPFGLGHFCLAVIVLGVIGLLFFVRYIISL